MFDLDETMEHVPLEKGPLLLPLKLADFSKNATE